MRTYLAIILLAWVNVSFAQSIFLPFPSEIQGGRSGLEKWVNANADRLPSAIEVLAHPMGEIVMLYHHRGFGRPLLDIYVYGCKVTTCSLLAVKRGVFVKRSENRALLTELKPDGSELVVRSPDGKVVLSIGLVDG